MDMARAGSGEEGIMSAEELYHYMQMWIQQRGPSVTPPNRASLGSIPMLELLETPLWCKSSQSTAYRSSLLSRFNSARSEHIEEFLQQGNTDAPTHEYFKRVASSAPAMRIHVECFDAPDTPELHAGEGRPSTSGDAEIALSRGDSLDSLFGNDTFMKIPEAVNFKLLANPAFEIELHLEATSSPACEEVPLCRRFRPCDSAKSMVGESLADAKSYIYDNVMYDDVQLAPGFDAQWAVDAADLLWASAGDWSFTALAFVVGVGMKACRGVSAWYRSL